MTILCFHAVLSNQHNTPGLHSQRGTWSSEAVALCRWGLLLRDLKDPFWQPKYPRTFRRQQQEQQLNISTTNTGDYYIFVTIFLLWYQFIDTHEDFPLPVGPRIALRPGLIIPLRDNNTELSVANSAWINSFKGKNEHTRNFPAFVFKITNVSSVRESGLLWLLDMWFNLSALISFTSWHSIQFYSPHNPK